MNGAVIVCRLLLDHAPLVARVPADRIMAGYLPLNTPLPAISITSVSAQDLQMPSPGATRFVTERVQVTTLAPDYATQKAIQAHVKRAAAGHYYFNRLEGVGDWHAYLFEDMVGAFNIVVHTDGQGPDFMDADASIHMGSNDFRVKYSETR